MTEKLAIDGGAPVRDSFLPYARQSIDKADRAAVLRVLGSDWLTTGPEVARFEEALAARAGARHAVAVSSGTAALHLLYLAAGLKEGDEVVTSPLTFAATANAALYCGARPVFADTDDSLDLDPDSVEKTITKKTRAITAVHLTGRLCDMDRLREVAKKHKLLLLEDAAHALGGAWKGQPAGSLGDAAIFSFHPVKHVTTCEGGAVVTNDRNLAGRVRRLRNHGMDISGRERHGSAASWRYDLTELGYNYRLPDLACALGSSQLAKLDGFLARRREIAARYDEAFGGDARLRLPVEPEGSANAWHLYIVRLALERLTANRDGVFAALRAENIGASVHYPLVYEHTVYKKLGYKAGACPRAERAAAEILSLPLWPGMTDADAKDVVRAVRKVLDAYGKP